VNPSHRANATPTGTASRLHLPVYFRFPFGHDRTARNQTDDSMTNPYDYLQLSPAERILLAQDILDSVVAEAGAELLTPGQHAEIDRRIDDLRAGRVTCLPWEQVRDKFLSGQ